MHKISSVFNAAVQAGKDTINGFHCGDVWGGANALFGAYGLWRCAAVLGEAGLGTALLGPLVVTGLALGYAWQNGRGRRLDGLPPRYVP